MANAIAFSERFVPTATGAATGNATTGAISQWFPSLGAKEFTLQLHLDAGTATVVLEGANYVTNTGVTAVTPDVILTAVGGGAGDTYAKTTTPVPYQYLRFRCTAYAAGSGTAAAVGVR